MVTTPIMPERAVTRFRPRSLGRSPKAAQSRLHAARASAATRAPLIQRETPSDARHRPIEPPSGRSTEDDRATCPPVCVPLCSHPQRNAQTGILHATLLNKCQTFILSITENRRPYFLIKVQETQMASRPRPLPPDRSSLWKKLTICVS